MSVDDEQTEDDAACRHLDLTFIADKDFLDQYGSRFKVILDERLYPVVIAE